MSGGGAFRFGGPIDRCVAVLVDEPTAEVEQHNSEILVDHQPCL